MRIFHRTYQMTIRVWARTSLPTFVKSLIGACIVSLVVFFLSIFPLLRKETGEVRRIGGIVVTSGFFSSGRVSVVVALDNGLKVRVLSSTQSPLKPGLRVEVEERVESIGQSRYFLVSDKQTGSDVSAQQLRNRLSDRDVRK